VSSSRIWVISATIFWADQGNFPPNLVLPVDCRCLEPIEADFRQYFAVAGRFLGLTNFRKILVGRVQLGPLAVVRVPDVRRRSTTLDLSVDF
jgi:hypothetical protein